MKKLILILGGARSGKSSYAVKLAKGANKKVAFIATAACLDEEMEKRIKLHKRSRPKSWKLIEEDRNISSVIPKLKAEYAVVIVDCLSLLISNLLADNLENKKIEKAINDMLNSILINNRTTIIVSNDVGSGIVPDNPLARRFRDVLGLANQKIAKKANEVILMQAGIPIIIKNAG